jgi:hypothetical protein
LTIPRARRSPEGIEKGKREKQYGANASQIKRKQTYKKSRICEALLRSGTKILEAVVR